MKLFTEKKSYDDTIVYAQQLTGAYDDPVIFHCYWNTTRHGGLSEKHLYSILSCWYFNVRNNRHKIILWLENTELNEYAEQIKQYAEIKQFNPSEQIKDTFLENYVFKHPEGRPGVKYYSAYVRLVLLYNYGGFYFDLDCFFLRNFDPLFAAFSDDLCVYDQTGQIPNNAVVLSLQPQSKKAEALMMFFVNRNLGWSFSHPDLTYDTDIDVLSLPGSWFDPMLYIWYNKIPNWLTKEDFLVKTDKTYTFDNFYKGAFCYHWHSGWSLTTEETAIISQLVKIIENDLNATSQKQDETHKDNQP